MAGRKISSLLCLLCFILAFLLGCNLIKTFSQNNTKHGHINLHVSHMKSSRPYEYPEEVNLRIIVLAFNRDESLKKCLDSLQNIHIDSGTAAMEIWIDKNSSGKIHLKTLELAERFNWTHGLVRVHVWSEHVGIYGQWIGTWRPKENSREIAVFLEDDVDVSPYFYHWLRAAHAFYDHRKDIGSIGLASNNVQISNGINRGKMLKLVNSEKVYLYRMMISWGMSPMPGVWRKFQDWFYEKKVKFPGYKPYTRGATLQTSWYRSLESAGKSNTMWTIWFINYCDLNHLYTLHPNIVKVGAGGGFLAMNRKERGLHFNGKSSMTNSTKHLLLSWSGELIQFPTDPVKYGYNGIVEKV